MNTIVTDRFIFCHHELKRLRRIRSSRQFAISLEYLPQSLSEILKGRRDVTVELLRRAVEKYALNPAFLLTGLGDCFDNSDISPTSDLPTAHEVPDVSGISYLPARLQKRYIDERRNKVFLSMLEHVKVPGMQIGNVSIRAFELNSTKCSPAFASGDILLAVKLDPASGLRTVEAEKLYVLVTRTAILFQQISLESLADGVLTLHYETCSRGKKSLALADLLELWEVKAKITRNLTDQTAPFRDILGELQDIKQYLTRRTEVMV